MNDYKFGNFLCMLREKNGMTQADIAEKLGVTPAAVSKWENGSAKPRVEILFQLAQLLGVRAEELMSGEYISDETLDPQVVKQINERYAYLMRADTYNSANVKLRRILAWLLDWIITIFLMTVVLAAILIFLITLNVRNNIDDNTFVKMLMALYLLYPVCFVLRDLIFKGRSLGKRILGLVVLDKQTGEQAKPGKCVLRNLFLFIAQIDVIFMLASGTSIGDCVVNTVVVPKSIFNNDFTNQITEINTYSAPKKHSTKKTLLTVVGIIALPVVLIFSIVLIALSTAKNTEEYKIAYDYFVESQTFKTRGFEESEIRFNKYERTTKSEAHGDSVAKTAIMGFVVDGEYYQVTCHEQNDVWLVCEECTAFR